MNFRSWKVQYWASVLSISIMDGPAVPGLLGDCWTALSELVAQPPGFRARCWALLVRLSWKRMEDDRRLAWTPVYDNFSDDTTTMPRQP